MSDTGEEPTAEALGSFSSRSTRPPKITARDVGGQPDPHGKVVYLLDPMEVRQLASALGLKPFRVTAELMEMRLFKSPDDLVDFQTASRVAQKHGFRAERPPPGMLIL